MAYLHDDVLDNGLQVLTDDVTHLHLCSQLPTTYAQATSTYSIAVHDAPTVTAPGAATPDGRKVTVGPETGGTVTVNETEATHWALVDASGSRLLAASTLDNTQMLYTVNPVNTASFDVRKPAVS